MRSRRLLDLLAKKGELRFLLPVGFCYDNEGLTTGIGRDNKPLRPPMPQFRMTVEDARAVFAYLKSLGSQKQ
jgi:hypothetical protein